ncbi:hypothetical protein BB559_003203 [Furculomyces boomerangus]|uniref:Uncharacterized protein n=1 Tax=Furculomyces boomerangus TaxID=61424 RepID=A0A2T9YMX8_9FUNG|nr:hypothetical protein BB559_003203 [Furculomyces boomerangus]
MPRPLANSCSEGVLVCIFFSLKFILSGSHRKLINLMKSVRKKEVVLPRRTAEVFIVDKNVNKN